MIMCTAATYKTLDFYFGRTLDYEFSYGETVTIMPRNYEIKLRFLDNIKKHYAIIGMAHVTDSYPLFYEAMNEKGLCIAGLNFVGNAHYFEPQKDKINVAQFEFIPYILVSCKSVDEVIKLMKNINITNTPYSDKYPIGQLHWIVADHNKSITIESTSEGIRVYDNPVGVLTNNPPFDKQMENLNNYKYLSTKNSKNSLNDDKRFYSRGLGAVGLPGDISSQSRFVRVAFTKMNSLSKSDELSSVSQFFHILGSVDQVRGCCELEDKKYEITIYTSCLNATKGIYYYTTYDNHQINKVDMHKVDLDSKKLFEYKLHTSENIYEQN